MIRFSQKLYSLAAIAAFSLNCASTRADDSTLIEWNVQADPVGLFVDLEMFQKPEIRGNATADQESGTMKFDGGSMVLPLSDEGKFRQLLQKNDEITVAVTVIPTTTPQDGPARIISYSSDSASRNFTIGQNGDRFDLRLLTEGGDPNGIISHSQFGNIEAGKEYEIIASYRPGKLMVTLNGKLLISRGDIRGGLKNWGKHSLIFGDELTGDRAWRGEILGISMYNRARDLAPKPPVAKKKRKKKHEHKADPTKELKETCRAVADLKKKIGQLSQERDRLQLRIKAGDKAGEDLEELLTAARALAHREHAQAEKISAQILEQVDAQRAIAQELKETIALVQREREELQAKLKSQPKVDPELHQRLIAENEKLSEQMREAWERSKSMGKAAVEREKARAERRVDEEKTWNKNKLEMLRAIDMQAKLKAETDEAKARLKNADEANAALREKIGGITAAKAIADRNANAERAKAVIAMKERMKLESKLAKLNAVAEAAALAEEAERAAEAARIKKLLSIAPIYFGKNQAASSAQEKSLLAQVAEIHKTYPEARFAISGHTCTDGSPAGNIALSQRRAQRVANLLKNNRIPESAIAGVVGKGEAEPIADNSTQQGREANRRVEIKVLRK